MALCCFTGLTLGCRATRAAQIANEEQLARWLLLLLFLSGKKSVFDSQFAREGAAWQLHCVSYKALFDYNARFVIARHKAFC